MKSIRSLVIAILLVTAFSCVAIAFANTKKPLSPAQRKASNRCIEIYLDAVTKCLDTHPYLSSGDCSKMEETIYQDCMQRAGLARQAPPEVPPKVNPHGKSTDAKPTGSPSGVKQPSPTPRFKPTRTLDNSVITTNTGKPTPTASPKSTPQRKN